MTTSWCEQGMVKKGREGGNMLESLWKTCEERLKGPVTARILRVKCTKNGVFLSFLFLFFFSGIGFDKIFSEGVSVS